MPSVINQVLIPSQTVISPHARFQSQVFDVNGTESISVNVSTNIMSSEVTRTIFFGPSPNGGFEPARVDTFAASHNLLTSLPTNGPQMFVVVENNAPIPLNCDGWLYGVRLVP
jgi:hypothetical protein